MGKIKVLHFFGKMDRGGAETFIMNVYRNVNRESVKFEFVVVNGEKGNYDDEIKQLGGKIHVLPSPKLGLQRYKKELVSLLLREKYDVVHSHVHYFSGVNLKIARKCGVRIRIAHSHTSNMNKRFSLRRTIYEKYMKLLIDRNANHLLGCSKEALDDLFLNSDNRVEIVNNGIEIEEFMKKRLSKEEYRKLIGLPEGAFVIGHIGGFRPEKNHTQLIRMFHYLSKKYENAHLVLVGDGILRNKIEEKVSELSLEHKVHILGVRSDITDILRSFDVFVFPSLYEGLGIAVIEAQVSGLKCVVSDKVPQEVDITGNVSFLSLNSDFKEWEESIMNCDARPIDDKRIKKYDIKSICVTLLQIYEKNL